MSVDDVNGDGLNDVVTRLFSHGYGIAWFEQKRDAQKKISFVERCAPQKIDPQLGPQLVTCCNVQS